MDTSLAATGKDTTVEILYNGAPVKVLEKVRFTAKKVVTKTETRPLGSTTRLINTEPDGWSGTIECEMAGKAGDELIDLLTSAEILRVPGVIAISETTNYRDFSRKTYVYPDVKITDYEKTVARGENIKLRLSWETGQNRVAA